MKPAHKKLKTMEGSSVISAHDSRSDQKTTTTASLTNFMNMGRGWIGFSALGNEEYFRSIASSPPIAMGLGSAWLPSERKREEKLNIKDISKTPVTTPSQLPVSLEDWGTQNKAWLNEKYPTHPSEMSSTIFSGGPAQTIPPIMKNDLEDLPALMDHQPSYFSKQ